MYAFHYALFYFNLSNTMWTIFGKIFPRVKNFILRQILLISLFSVWSWYALCDIKISKEKNPEKNNFLQLFRDTIMIGTRDIMGTFSSGSSGLSHIHLQYHKKTSLNTCLLIRSRKKSIVKLKVYKSGYNRYFW